VLRAVAVARSYLTSGCSTSRPSHQSPTRKWLFLGYTCQPTSSSEAARVPRKPKSHTIYELRVVLEDVKPAVWRTFRFPADATLHDLHGVLQVVMGWTNSHLHAFEHDGDRYAEPGPDFEMDGADIDTDDVTVGELLRRIGDVLGYEYDFGDGWSHTVSLQAISTDGPEVWCLDGKRACPPDDCGGPMGYANLLSILAKPKHPEHRDMLEWLEPAYPDGFHPEAFDRDEINEQFADGLEGIRADFEDALEDEDLDDLKGAEPDESDRSCHPEKPRNIGNIIQFPKR
jgi:hypothetical protein